MSEIRATTISDAAGTGPITLTGQSAPKAWISYNGTTNAIRSSFNTSSMTDNATGDFAQNFTSSFDGNDNACATGSKSNQTSNSGNAMGISVGGSGGQLDIVVYEVGTKVDALNNFFITTGDLA